MDVPPIVILAIGAIFGLYLLGQAAVHEVKHLGHETKTAIHHVLHPHDHKK